VDTTTASKPSRLARPNRVEKRKQYSKVLFSKNRLKNPATNAGSNSKKTPNGSKRLLNGSNHVPSRSFMSVLNGGRQMMTDASSLSTAGRQDSRIQASSSSRHNSNHHHHHHRPHCRRHNSLTSLRSVSSAVHQTAQKQQQQQHQNKNALVFTPGSAVGGKRHMSNGGLVANTNGATGSSNPASRAKNTTSLVKKHNKIMNLLLAARASISKFQIDDDIVNGGELQQSAALARPVPGTSNNTSFNLDSLVRIKRSSLYKLKSNNQNRVGLLRGGDAAATGDGMHVNLDEFVSVTHANSIVDSLKSSDLPKNKKKVSVVPIFICVFFFYFCLELKSSCIKNLIINIKISRCYFYLFIITM
jgi:hypothetical protein